MHAWRIFELATWGCFSSLMYLDFFLVEILQNPLNFNLPLLSVWWIAPPGRKSQRGILINQFTILINFRPQVLILQLDMLSFPITPWSPFLAWPQYKRACWYRQQILSPAPMWSHTATAKGSKQNTISKIFILHFRTFHREAAKIKMFYKEFPLWKGLAVWA